MSKARLDTMVEEATVDCYNESEQRSGLFTVIEDELTVPFKTQVLGVDITVERLDLNDEDQIVAICSREYAKKSSRRCGVGGGRVASKPEPTWAGLLKASTGLTITTPKRCSTSTP